MSDFSGLVSQIVIPKIVWDCSEHWLVGLHEAKPETLMVSNFTLDNIWDLGRTGLRKILNDTRVEFLRLKAECERKVDPEICHLMEEYRRGGLIIWKYLKMYEEGAKIA